MRYGTWLLIVLAVCLLFPASHQGAQLEQQDPFPFSTFELKNGLTVILAQDDTLPVVTVAVAYKVGSMHEDLDKSGLAHLMENLMFGGSRNVSRMQHVRFIQRIGGRLNAVTERDRTIFYQTVPSHHLASILWLESDRMTSLSINQANVDFWKSTLQTELKMRESQDPFLEGAQIFDILLYPEYAINHFSLGTQKDLASLSVKDVRDFYEAYYRPNNAVLCITGNIELSRTGNLVRKYFQGLPRGPNISPPLTSRSSDIPDQAMTRTLQNPTAPTPGFFLGYRIPEERSIDYYALTLIEYILMRGNSSRLYQRLIKREERLASQLTGGIDVRHDWAAFQFVVFSSNELKIERSLKEIFSEINKLKSAPVSEKELLKAKNVFKRDYVNRYTTSVDKSLFLTNAFISGIPWAELPTELDRYMSVTARRIMFTMKYFSQDRVLVHVKTK